jgi:type VI secretion system secreted protein Hcp
MAIFMKFDGIEGDATDEKHKNWIPLNSVSFASNREARTAIGAADQRQGTNVSISDVTVSKPMDLASPKLFLASVVGFGKKVTIDISRSGETEGENYLQLILDKACVTSYSIQSDGKQHTESLTLNFLKVTKRYWPAEGDNTVGAAIPVCFDIAEGTDSAPDN